MPNLSALAPLTTAATSLANLILVSPNSVRGIQPQNLAGEENKPLQETFLFQFEAEQSISLESDITDHYLDNNLAYEDQIAMKPVTYSTYGYIGELTDIAPDFLQPVKDLANKLVAIGAYQPQLTVSALIAYNTALAAYQAAATVANSAVSAWQSISNSSETSFGATFAKSQSKQQLAFQKLWGYWNERRLFTVQTPWAIFQNMAIQNLKAIQPEETRTVTDFEIKFKQLRFAATDVYSGLDASLGLKFQGQAATQSAPGINLGTSAPNPNGSISVSSGISSLVA
jgi:hypothetical protein